MDNCPKDRSAWFALVNEFEQSNITQKDFCKQKGLILGRFTYYVQIYRQSKKPTSKNELPSFTQVTVNQSSFQHEIKVELPNGFRCQVPSSILPEALKKIMGVLLSC